MTETFCLKWSEFQENISTSISTFKDAVDFTDVTLVCEDGQQVEAHKVILAASSPFFENLLRRNKHPHPLIYLRGFKLDIILSILDFVYKGETNVSQDYLDRFLGFAEELKLKGLAKSEHKTEEICEDFNQGTVQTKPNKDANISIKSEPMSQEDVLAPSQSSTFIGEFNEIEEKVCSLMAKTDNRIPSGLNKTIFARTCTVCGKEGTSKNIKDHIEANHLEGISLPCTNCDKLFKTRNSLRKHFALHNKQNDVMV